MFWLRQYNQVKYASFLFSSFEPCSGARTDKNTSTFFSVNGLVRKYDTRKRVDITNHIRSVLGPAGRAGVALFCRLVMNMIYNCVLI